MQRTHRPFPLLLLLLFILSLTAACAGHLPASTRDAAFTPKTELRMLPAAARLSAPEVLPPVLMESTPPDGASWHGGPVVLAFDQPMDPKSAASVSVEPALGGDVTVQENRIIFTPGEDPVPGQRYTLRVDVDARSAAGIPLTTPVELSLMAALPLQVTATQPSDGAVEVSTDGQIVVIFNRPVVPLTGLEEQASLPQPLTLEPAVEGSGTWLNTSVYAFTPARGLAGATRYRATVADVTAVGGETLEAPYVFTFTTAAPTVVQATPAGELVRPDSVIQVIFSQAMDPASTEAAFAVHPLDDPTPLPGELAWNRIHTTLTFTPTAPLDFGATYVIAVDETAQPASRQGNLRAAFRQEFTVVPLPAVALTDPTDGEEKVSPDRSVFIRFNAPVSPTLVLQNVTVTPVLSTTRVYSYYAEYNNELTLSWFKEPNTTYTVTVGAAIADEYGNTLGRDYVFSFTTGDYPPFVRLSLDRFTHFSAYTRTQASLLYRNVDDIRVDLYRLPEPELFKLTGSNQWQVWDSYQVPNPAANLVWSRHYESAEERNVTIRQVITLTDEAGNVLPPGAYLLEAHMPRGQSAQEAAPGQSRAVVLLSNHNLVVKKSLDGTSLAWLTDLQTGQAVPGTEIRFYADGELLGQAVTDEQGVATARLAFPPDRNWVPLLAVAGTPGEADYVVVSSEWSSGIAIWDFNLPGGYSLERYQSYFYTDRPIYRPGQTVYWKGIVRELVDDQYRLPSMELPITVTIRDDRGNAVFTQDYTPDSLGTLTGELALAPEATTGYYYLEARMQVTPEQFVYGATSFQVAAYEKPEFQISVAPDQPAYVQGDTVRITVQADYFSGGALANAPVTWRLLSEPYHFYWEQAPRGRAYSFMPFDPAQERYDPYQAFFYLGLIQEGEGRTDGNGTFVIELPADIAQVAQSQNWTFDVTVQSPTNQWVSGRTTVPVHKGEFYVGLSPQEYVVTVGQGSTVDLVTVTPQGEPYPGATLKVMAYEFVWNSVYEQAADGSYRWTTSVERTPVFTETVITDRQGMATVTWAPPRGGQYQVVATGQDDRGNPVSSSVFIWVSSEEFVAWPRENNDRMELVADRTLYAPGDTAQILVPSPFQGPVQALVTIERGGVLESRVITLNGNSETLEIPVTADYIPNVYVGVILVKGVDETNPTPAMRVGYVQLAVDTSRKELGIQITPSATTVRPGDTVTYTLTVTDNTGQPVAGVDLSAAVVDKAVLSLAQGDIRSLLDVFYTQRPLAVSTGALLVINQDRLSQQLSEGAKGGGGGGPGGLEIRQNFPDIAYWQAHLTTDEDGQVQFSVTLPDNLTTWRLVVKAITADTRVGDAVHDVVATKELQVRPILPRFFTAGDRVQIGAVVLNATDQALAEGRFTVAVSGGVLGTKETTRLLSLDANGQARFNFPLEVPSAAEQVVITFTAQAGALADGVRTTLPVVRYETPETVATAGEVSTEPGSVLEAIRLPAGATDNGQLVVNVEPSLAAGLVDGLNYLRHFPYECNEQTVSRFLPNLFTVRALRTLGVENEALSNNLSYQVGIAVQRLTSRQNLDGGWGFWPGEASSPFITTYVLWGLSSAQEMGYTVPASVLQNGVNYLEGTFLAPKDVRESWRLNEMAFTHFVLSEMGQGDPGRMATLYDVRERLGHYGKAFLAMALDNLDEDGGLNARTQTLLDDLVGAARITATGASWHEETVDWWTLNSDVRTTAIVLGALTRLHPAHPLLPQAVRWLMEQRKNGRWATTQENAWSIIGLTDWLATSGELQADYSWSVLLNGQELGSGAVGPENLTDKVQLQVAVADLLRSEANALQFNRAGDTGRLYYTTYLTYYQDALAVEARDRGIVVDRRFDLPGSSPRLGVSSAAVGDVISVTVTIVAPTDLHQLLVEVPIPASTEPIDTSLATASLANQGPEFRPVEDVGGGQPAWRYWLPSNVDIRDDRVALFASYVQAGTYQYTFQVRASIPGEFRVLPAYAEQMYFNEVWGRSSGALFTVTE